MRRDYTIFFLILLLILGVAAGLPKEWLFWLPESVVWPTWLPLPKWLASMLQIALANGLVVLAVMMQMRAGLVSLGQGLYFCLGGYAAAMAGTGQLIDFINAIISGINTAIAWVLVDQDAFMLPNVGNLVITDAFLLLGIGVIVAVIVAAILGLLLARYRAIFYAMLTLAFSMVLYSALVKSSALGSTDGFNLPNTTFGYFFPEGDLQLYTAFILTVLVVFLVSLIAHRFLASRTGRLAEAIRDNEIRVEYLGGSAYRTNYAIYVLSAAISAVGGVLVAIAIGHVDPQMVFWTTSGEFVFVALLSGSGSVIAPILGAILFEAIRSQAGQYAPNTWQMIIGVVMLFIILFLPRGLWSLISPVRKKNVSSSRN